MKKMSFCTVFIFMAFALAAVPQTPGNLTLAYDAGAITASWDAIADTNTAYYVLYRGTYQGFSQADYNFITYTASSAQLALSDTTINSSDAYYYKAAAVDAFSNTSALSYAKNAFPFPPASAYLNPLNAKVFLSWAGNYDGAVTGYNVYRSTLASSGYSFLNFTKTPDYLDSDAALVNGKTYYYRLSAFSDKAGPYTAPYQAVPFAAPYAPKLASFTAESGNTVVNLTWSVTGSAGTYAITGYNIYRSTFQNPLELIHYAQGVTTSHFADAGLAAAYRYYYALKAVDIKGNTSLPYSFSVLAPPSAPGSLTFTATHAGVRLAWTAAEKEITQYRIYKSQGAALALLDTINNTNTAFYLDAAVNTYTQYYYAVSALNASGETATPGWMTATAWDTAAIAAPTGLTVTASNTAGVLLDWSENAALDGVTQYNIYRANTEYFDGASVVYDTSTADTYTDTAVVPGTLYYYALKAGNLYGLSPFSTYAGVTVVPAAPENFAAAPSTFAAGVVLTWDDNAPAEPVTQYNIYRATSPGFENTYTYPAVTLTSYEDISAQVSVINYYRISGVNSVEGNYSALTFTPFAAPAAPLNLTGSGKNTYAALSWDASPSFENVTLYNIYRSTDTLNYIRHAGSTLNAYTDAGLTNGLNYLYEITGTNRYGEGAVSAFVSVTPAALAVLNAPLGVTALSAGDGKLSLAWQGYNPADGVSGYNIYRSTIAGQSGAAALHAFSGSAGFTDAIMNTANADSVSNTTVYYYSIAAHNGSASPLSNEVAGKPYVLPFAPNNINGTYAASSVILTWDAPSGEYTNKTIPNYIIRRSTSQSEATFVNLTQTADTFYEDVTIDTGMSVYYYKVKTVDDLGNTDVSQATEAVIITPLTQGPDFIKAVPGDGSVLIFWRKVTSDSYNIYRSTIPGVYGERIATVSQIKKEYTDTAGLQNETTYYYTLTTQNGTGEGPKSGEVYATPYAAVKLPADSALKSEIVDKKDLRIDWEAATQGSYAIVGYELLRSSDGGGTYVQLTLTTQTQYLDTLTEWGNTYYYKLTVLDAQANKDAVYSILSIELPNPANKLRVFANMINLSAGEKLKLRFQAIEDGNVKINVYTLSGEFVRTILEDKTSGFVSKDSPYESADFYWDGTGASGQKVASGVYLLSLEIKGKRFVKKIAVVK